MAFLRSAALVLLTAIIVAFLPIFFKPKVDTNINGFCTKEFTDVKQAFQSLFASGLERGSALSVYHQGEPVCDLWAGLADDNILRPWQRDSMSCFFSTTKGVGAITLMHLHDSGAFSYKDLVKKYWPQFAKNGKEAITIEMLMSHAGGLAAIDTEVTYEMMMNDPVTIAKALEDQKPNWEPGKHNGYHALSYGMVVDQLVRHIDPKHRSIQQYFQEEIAKPFDIDFFIGAPPEEHHRIVWFHSLTIPEILTNLYSNPVMAVTMIRFLTGTADPLPKRAFNNPSPATPEGKQAAINYWNWPEGRMTPLASAAGFGTARGVGKLYGILANGGTHKGKVLLKKESVEMLNTPVRFGEDLVMKKNITFGLGVMINKDPEGSNQRFGHPGYGGQMGFADLKNNWSYGYVTNRPSLELGENDKRSIKVREAIYKSIDRIKGK